MDDCLGEVKPSCVLKIGDEVEIRLGQPIKLVVRSLNEKASKDEACSLYEIRND